MRKSIVRLGSVLVLLTAACAVCFGVGGREGTAAGTSAGAAGAIKGSISVFTPESNTWPEYVPTIEKFMKDFPDIKVDFGSVKHDQYIASLQTKFAANDLPDVFMGFVGIAQYENYIKRGYLMDLTGEPFLDRLTDAARKGVEYQGKVYGVPINVQLIGIIYNKAMYRKAGISVPTTWEELMANCEALKKAGMTPFTLGVKDSYVAQFLPYTIWPSTLYGRVRDFEAQRVARKVKYDSPEWKKALEMNFEVFRKGYTNEGVLGLSYDQMIEMFATEKAAMVAVGDWCVEALRKINPKLDAGFFATPAPKGYDLVLESQTGGVFVIWRDSKSPAAAKKFVQEFVTNPDYYYKWNGSPIQSLKGAPVPTDPLYKEFADVYKNGKNAYPFINQMWINASLGDTFCRAMQDVYAGTKTVDDLAKEFDEAFEKILPEYLKGQ